MECYAGSSVSPVVPAVGDLHGANLLLSHRHLNVLEVHRLDITKDLVNLLE
jgi:hypothetical protein